MFFGSSTSRSPVLSLGNDHAYCSEDIPGPTLSHKYFLEASSSQAHGPRKAKMSQSYKALKEDFVSNLSGGDITEINYVTAVAPVPITPQSRPSHCIANIPLDCGPSLVCPAVTSRFLPTLWIGSIRSGFSAQRCRNPAGNDTIFWSISTSQRAAHYTSRYALSLS